MTDTVLIWFIPAVLSLFYALILSRFILGLCRLKPDKTDNAFAVSVIIPARNEQENLTKCLNSMVNVIYPRDRLEIMVINDGSTDQTQTIIDEFSAKYAFIKSINTKDFPPKYTYKKNAIYHGICSTSNELIATVDADCTVQPGWLLYMTGCMNKATGAVSGPVQINRAYETNLRKKVESIEFYSLVLCGAGSLGTGYPLIANGANFLYRRETFEAIEGFRDIEQLASGDDDLFIQKIHKHGKWRVRFCASKQAVNYTRPAESLPALFRQRTRWATKGVRYKNGKLVAALGSIFLFFCWLFFGTLYTVFLSRVLLFPLLLSWTAKIAFEAGVFICGMRLLGRFDLLKYFPAAQIIHVPYILVSAVAGLFNKTTWKGRRI